MTTHYKEMILPILQKNFPDAIIYLFGSRATGRFREGSDIDIALKTGYRIDSHKIARTREELEDNNIPVKIDLLDYEILPESFKEEINQKGIVWTL